MSVHLQPSLLRSLGSADSESSGSLLLGQTRNRLVSAGDTSALLEAVELNVAVAGEVG